MINRNDEEMGKILSQILSKRKQAVGRGGCPDEESLAGYLSGILADDAKEKVEAHLAQCSYCLEETVAAYKAGEDQGLERVPQRLLNKAKGLVKETETLFDLVVRFVKDSVELVSSVGFATLTPVPVGVRGAGTASAEKILQMEKQVGRFKLGLELEQVETGVCRIAARVTESGGKPVDGVRLSLIAGGREQASFLTRGGQVAFDRVPQGDYSLALSESGGPVGTVKLSLVS
jgi:hypothetical protein